MNEQGARIAKRWETFSQMYYNHLQKWDRMAPWLLPSRSGIVSGRVAGDSQNKGVYDSTMMTACELGANFIASNIINPANKWLDLRMESDLDNKIDPVREWLDETAQLWLDFASRSTFYQAGPETLQDWLGFGEGALLCEEAPAPINRRVEGFRGFKWRADKIGHFHYALGPDGQPDTYYAEMELSTRQIVEQWGDPKPGAANTELGEEISKDVKEGKWDTLHKVIQAIEPRPLRDQDGISAKGMPWASRWIVNNDKHLIHEGGYRVFPVAIPRYAVAPSETRGRGRGELAFPDEMSLDTAKRLGLEDHALKVKPAVMVRHDGVIGTLRLRPGMMNTIKTHGGDIRHAVMPWETGTNPALNAIKEEELRRSIDQVFFVDQIREIMRRQPPQMTATEFVERIQLLFRLIGQAYGNLEFAFLMKLVNVGFDVMLHGRAVPPPPPQLLETAGGIKVVFLNPISRTQHRGDIEAITLAFADLAPFAEAGMPVFDRWDPDKLAQEVFRIRGVPASVERSDEELEEYQASRARMANQEMAVQEAVSATEAVKNVTPLIQEPRGGRAA